MASPSSPIADPRVFIGCKLSVTSNADIRYEGTLYKYDENASTIALQYVHAFGTEDRRRDVIPPSSDLFEFVIFRVADIKDLEVSAPPKIDLSRSRTNSISGDSAVLKCAAVPAASKPLTFKISPTAMMAWFQQQQQSDASGSSHAAHQSQNQQRDRQGTGRRGRGRGGYQGRGGNMNAGASIRAGGTAQRTTHLAAPWKDEYQNVWGSEKLCAQASDDAELGELSLAAHQFDYLDKVLNPADWLTADKFLKLAAFTSAKTEESDEDPKSFYDPEAGFFDNISCEAKTAENGQNRTRQHEKKLNAETFNLPQRQQQRFRYPQQGGGGGRGPNATPRRQGRDVRDTGSNNANNYVRSSNNNNNNNTSRSGGIHEGQVRQIVRQFNGGRGGNQQRQQQSSRANAESWSSFEIQQQPQQGGRRRGPSNGRRFGGNNNTGNRQQVGSRQMGKGQFVPSRVSENLVEFVSKLPLMISQDHGGAIGGLGLHDRATSSSNALAPAQFKWTFPTAFGGSASETVADENNGDFDFVRDKGLTVDGVAQ